MEGKQEAAYENSDRVWRRWRAFCHESGVGDDLHLRETPPSLPWCCLLGRTMVGERGFLPSSLLGLAIYCVI